MSIKREFLGLPCDDWPELRKHIQNAYEWCVSTAEAKLIKQRPALTRDQKILSLSPVVHAVAHTYNYSTPKSVTFQELESAGWRGAIDAVDKFEPARHTFLAVYGKQRIRGAILDYLRSIDYLTREHRKAIKNGEAAPITVASLFRANSDGETQLIDVPFNDPILERLEESEETNRVRLEVSRLLADSHLDERQLSLVNDYYFKGRTLKQAGQSVGVCESRAKQLLSKLLDQMRAYAKTGEIKVPKQSKWIEDLRVAASIEVGVYVVISGARTQTDVAALRMALTKHILTRDFGWSLFLTANGAKVTKCVKKQREDTTGYAISSGTARPVEEVAPVAIDTHSFIPAHPSEAKFADLSLRFYSEEQDLSEAEWTEINDKVLPKMASEIALHVKAKEKTHAVLDPWFRMHGNEYISLKARTALAELYIAVYDQISQERLEARVAIEKLQEELRLAKANG